jgi:hypothetical protein
LNTPVPQLTLLASHGFLPLYHRIEAAEPARLPSRHALDGRGSLVPELRWHRCGKFRAAVRATGIGKTQCGLPARRHWHDRCRIGGAFGSCALPMLAQHG